MHCVVSLSETFYLLFRVLVQNRMTGNSPDMIETFDWDVKNLQKIITFFHLCGMKSNIVTIVEVKGERSNNEECR